MTNLHRLHDDVAVVGWACRLPGANSISELWSLLLEGRCAVSRVPGERFSQAEFKHPRKQERGKAYVFAAGVIDDIWGFDPTVFGISPREAEQMDPQQRILLQLTWEALEDAGIPPSRVEGTEVGVYVGGSLTDYSNALYGDPALGDAHFATGNALSCLSNRISYAFDFHGPSVTVDTACSSSLVALHQAAEALRAGRIDTAIVGGINIIASPLSFVTFSQASMLSPTGLCHAFDASADGFVRAEGGVVLVLRRTALANQHQNPIHGTIVASDVNSDGRTNGISLPSGDAQERLLDRIYARAGIAPSRLAFVEAHGTGTAVGDPIEAGAIGRSLGRDRSHPLPIGSIKTNIGHLEPASGLAGLLKAMLSLNHGLLPPTLHFKTPNPNIDFGALNLAVCDQSLLLPNVRQQYAGVNSFGFGGTNAHIVVAPGRRPHTEASHDGAKPAFFTISAETKPALTDLAKRYRARIATLSDSDTAVLASAAAHRRERLSHQLVVSSTRRDEVADALRAFADDNAHSQLTTGISAGSELPPAFVYSGNGGQRAGMGVAAYRASPAFRDYFDRIDALFRPLSQWSLTEALLSERLGERLHLTSVAQPLIFAIQCASTAALRAQGLRPVAVLGHSVGEVAAAEAAGILDLASAVRVIFFRSQRQEEVRGAGGMFAVSASAEAADQLTHAVPGLEIAAVNSPRAITVAGSTETLERLKAVAAERGIACLDLRLDYPFHTSQMQPIRDSLLADLAGLTADDGTIPFVSTVSGACVPGTSLGAAYWWRNIREPVRFSDAIRAAAQLGVRSFVEIGPNSLLLKHVRDSLGPEGRSYPTIGVLDTKDDGGDPFTRAVARGLVAGVRMERTALFGPDRGPVPLPTYPWQQKPFRFTPTVETAAAIEEERHPLSGVRLDADSLQWRAHVDTALVPSLADHQVGSQTLFPGMGFLEIGLSVAKQWLQTDRVTLANFEVLRPLDLTGAETHEILTRVSPSSNVLEILSRRRLSKAGWTLNCRTKMLHGRPPQTSAVPVPVPDGPASAMDGDALYRVADACGLHYGPAFRLCEGLVRHDGDLITASLTAPTAPTPYVLDPVRLDACLHAVISIFPELHAAERGVSYVPARLDEATIFVPGAPPRRTVIDVISKTERSIVCDIHVLGLHDEVIAVLRGARCQAIPVRRVDRFETTAISTFLIPADAALTGQTGTPARPRDILGNARALGVMADPAAEPGLDLQQPDDWETAAAYDIARALARGGAIDPGGLVNDGRVAAELRPWLVSLLRHLEAHGLAREQDGAVWRLISRARLPSSASAVTALAAAHPERASDILLAGAFSGLASRIASGEAALASPDMIAAAAIEFDAIAGTSRGDDAETLWTIVHPHLSGRPARALRVLEIGSGALARRIVNAQTGATVTVLDRHPHRVERSLSDLGRRGDILVSQASNAGELGTYDLILAAQGLSTLPARLELTDLRHAMAPGGLLVSLDPRPRFRDDFVRGLDPDWFAASLPDFPAGRSRPPQEWRRALADAGFAESDAAMLQVNGDSRILIAGKADARADTKPTGSTRLDGATIHRVTGSRADGDAVAALTAACLAMRDAAQAADAKTTLWLVFSRALGPGAIDCVSAGAWVFARTMANELAQLDVRRVDVAAGVSDEIAAHYIEQIVRSGTDETEIQIAPDGVKVVRADTVLRQLGRRDGPRAEAAKLERVGAANARLEWRSTRRAAPQTGEVEIAVEATGVNFRDLMWSLGLLPDDILENGFTGPTLGLECAGRIARVGSDVTGLAVGDRVLALAGSSFATHVTIPAAQAVKLPDGLAPEAAATIPVAFLTAFYSLVTQANLRRGEWVLIHGGAGGVGLAAVQIARSRGAKVIATAGSTAKRDLLRALGVRHVLDSRSTSFVDGVRRITGEGVDVVLNSLAAEAMEQSLACLRPFGRFVELGKRDFVANTHVGLRAFRNNITYHSVDVDQLVRRGDMAAKILRQIVGNVAAGRILPLPHTVFDAPSIHDAFALMQQSAHIGKIVVRPADLSAIRGANPPFVVDPRRTHLVTGAFGGFGLETAKWLVEKGARHLLLLGRSGPATDTARSAMQAFAEQGVKVLALPCDVADRRALMDALETASQRMPPMAGVIHAAMVLDDGILDNLDAERMRRVLDPKVRGADNLDALTDGAALDYFVLYSSVTTLIGNPGQGNYVAANAYMEALTRRRRARGLPGLAIGWGPITDVGIVARSRRLQANLEKLSGARGMTAREALTLMGEALEQSAGNPDLAAMTIAPNDGSFGRDRLSVLRSPTYAALLRNPAGGADGTEAIDVRALVQSSDAETVAGKVADVIVGQLARVLHARAEEINHDRPLGELGLDSLMALELGMSLQDSFKTQIALAGSVSNLSVAGLAEEIIAQASGHARSETADGPTAGQPVADADTMPASDGGDRRHAGTVH